VWEREDESETGGGYNPAEGLQGGEINRARGGGEDRGGGGGAGGRGFMHGAEHGHKPVETCFAFGGGGVSEEAVPPLDQDGNRVCTMDTEEPNSAVKGDHLAEGDRTWGKPAGVWE
jgi:hypothetical protein